MIFLAAACLIVCLQTTCFPSAIFCIVSALVMDKKIHTQIEGIFATHVIIHFLMLINAIEYTYFTHNQYYSYKLDWTVLYSTTNNNLKNHLNSVKCQ